MTVVAQVKYHTNPDWKTDSDAVQQVLTGMEKQDADLGWVVTCGRFSDRAKQAVEQASDTKQSVLSRAMNLPKMVVAFGMDVIHLD